MGGYYIRIHGGEWGNFIYATLYISSIFLFANLFLSKRLREKFNVLTNKHIFNYKYDYRSEWIKLINKLSRPNDHQSPSQLAISVAAEIFKCQGGALWLNRNHQFQLIDQLNTNIDTISTVEREGSLFYHALRDEWVFSPQSTSGEIAQHNERLPSWVKQYPESWLIFPLLTEKTLSGFMLLTRDNALPSINWEDLDLIKTVGRQLSNFITRHEQQEQLTEIRQFDAFNKLSAFVMHDLKNLIAQQSLVVKNAEKHKDNPAFIEDAINTINNSVQRMNHLLLKLQQSDSETVTALQLKSVFIEAIKRSQKRSPTPSLIPFQENIHVKADFDSLTMVFTHIIHNAQDATADTGFIDLSAQLVNDKVIITIEDNGSGMDENFIKVKFLGNLE